MSTEEKLTAHQELADRILLTLFKEASRIDQNIATPFEVLFALLPVTVDTMVSWASARPDSGATKRSIHKAVLKKFQRAADYYQKELQKET